MRRTPLCFVVGTTCALALAVACGGGAPTAAQAAKQAKAAVKDLRKAPSEGKDVKAAPKPAADPNKVELPWTFEKVRDAMEAGTVLAYARSGTNVKGKKIDDEFRWVVRRASADEVGTSGTITGGGEGQPSGEVALAQWTQFSPFFTVEKPTHELKGREKVTVPAGEFDVIVADIKGVFGNRKTVYMVVDKPGVYAKVVEHPNEGAGKDKTNLTWELKEITKVDEGKAGE